MLKMRKISKEYHLRQIVICWLACYMFLGIPAQVAMAVENPLADALPSGVIDRTGIDAPVYSPGRMDMTQTAGEAIVNWNNFDIGSSATVEFFQPGSAAAVLNRVHDGDVTGIMGSLTANGRVFVINPAGIVFGEGAIINVSQLVASSLNLADADFLNGAPYTFTGGATAGEVINNSLNTITAERIYLIGKTVTNRGALVAEDGYVVLAAGETVTISENGSSVAVEVEMAVPADHVVDNGGGFGTGDGTIETDHVILAAGDIWSTAISGVESLRAESYTNVTFTGDIEATGDVEITAGVFVDPPIVPYPHGGSADLKNISAGGELSVKTNHGLTIDGSAESGMGMTLKSDVDFWGGDDLIVTGTLTSGGNMDIEGLDITLGGDATATGNMDIFAHGRYLGGELGGGILTEGTDVEVQGNLTAGGYINISGNALDFGGDVRANGGDLTITGRNTKTDPIDGWGNIDVASGGTLYARDNIDILNLNGPDDMTLTGHDALSLIAETGTVTSDADIYTSSDGGSDADASVTIITGGDLTVDFDIIAEAVGNAAGNVDNDAIAGVTINAGGYVEVKPDSDVTVKAIAYDGVNNDADVTITANGDVKVIATSGDKAEIVAEAYSGSTNTSDIKITANDGHVLVNGEDGHAEITASAYDGVTNTATIDIDAVGDVRVTDIGGGTIRTAKIEAIAKDAIKSNTANILIGAIDDRVGGNVEVISGEVGNPGSGGLAYIEAIATNAYGDDGENTANVEIFTDGDVEVTGVEGGGASIAAKTWDASTNNSDVLICTDSVLVQGGAEMVEIPFSTAKIQAIAHSGENNNAYVGIGARGDVEVINYNASHSSIAARAYNLGMGPALSNNADVVICADGSVLVIDEGGLMPNMTAEIIAEATYGISNTADVGICADCDDDGDGDVVVAADNDGSAWIQARAAAGPVGPPIPTAVQNNDLVPPTSAIANVVVVSHGDDVTVTGESGGFALIKAFAHNAFSNEASVGVSGENIGVLASGHGVGIPSAAGILALAMDGLENTADTVICAPGVVTVIKDDGGEVGIGAAVAIGMGDDNATTQVYASDVIVSNASIGAYTPGGAAYVTDWSPGDDVPPSEGGATLILDDYSERQDCPDCPPCPECEEEEEELLAPVAPLWQLDVPRIEGCPVLTQAAAMELGITAETIQVAIGNALALNPSIQPCQACATLVNAANILRDEDGSRMAAMVQAFNALAPADAPFTPEMATSIAMAFEGADEGTQYASVMEYIDAFVQYVAVLDIELGSPVGDDSVAFVMEKYGAGITGSDNSNIAAFVATRLEAIGR